MYLIRSRCEEFKLPNIGSIKISGFSRSKFRTGYLIEPFDIYLDAGLPSPIPPKLILVSHGHLDHITELFSLLIQSKKTPVLLPNDILDSTQKLLNNFSSLNLGKRNKFSNWCPIIDRKFQIILKNTY